MCQSGSTDTSSQADSVSPTVDLVITGGGSAALAAASDALQRGQCVLVVLRAGDARVGRGFRRRLRTAANAGGSRVTVMTNAEIVCVDRVDSVEAAIIRYVRTGRLCAAKDVRVLIIRRLHDVCTCRTMTNFTWVGNVPSGANHLRPPGFCCVRSSWFYASRPQAPARGAGLVSAYPAVCGCRCSAAAARALLADSRDDFASPSQ